MGYLIPILVGSIAGIAVQAAFYRYMIRRHEETASGSPSPAQEHFLALEQELRSLLPEPGKVMSRKSLEQLEKNRDTLRQEVERLRHEGATISEKLKQQQASVEELELAQQNIKSTREEDEAALDEVRTNFDKIREEASELESQLADSQKELDELLKQAELTKAQRQFLQELQISMRTAGETLRQLLDEYREMETRLDTLTRQQHDLELEYTALVEKLLA